VQGEVKTPGRYTVDQPMTVMQAITTAGGWNTGANIEQVVVLRRDEEWRLVATMVDLRQALLGRRSQPVGEIFISDADLVIVPKGNLLLFDNFVNMVFTRGLYAIIPFQSVVSFTSLNYLNPLAAAATPIVQ
jgi:polysaccharide export outer membrane protein